LRNLMIIQALKLLNAWVQIRTLPIVQLWNT